MNKIRENILGNKKEYFIIFLILFSLVSFFIVDRYALDTYFYESTGMRYNAVYPYFHDGRLFMSAFLYSLSYLHISFATGKLISWLLAFISLFISIVLAYNMLLKYKKKKIITILISCCLVVNPFIIEYFMFPEFTGIMCLGVLFTFLCIYCLNNYFSSNKKKLLLVAFASSMCSVMCYQGAISLLFIIPFLFLLKDSKSFKKVIKRFSIVCLIFLAAALTTFALTKILGASRLGSSVNFISSFKGILKGLKILLLECYMTLPKYMLVIMAGITFVLTLITLKNYSNKLIFYILCILALLIVPALPHFFASYIWMVPRSNLGYGLLAVYPIVFYALYNKESKIVDVIFLSCMVVLLVSQTICAINYVKGAISNDTLNYFEAKKVSQEIEKYEKDNNISVNKIVVYYDASPTYVYENVKSAGDMNPRAFGYKWSYRAAINTRLNRTLIDGVSDKTIENYCKSKDWQSFDDEQIKFVNNTLHVCIY